MQLAEVLVQAIEAFFPEMPVVLQPVGGVLERTRIEPGTTVFFAGGVGASISGTGQLLAQGTDSAHIRIGHQPGSGNWGSLPLEGGIEAAYKAQLEASDDPDALRAEIERKLSARQSPFRTAEAFLIEEIIDPRDTRPLLCEFAELAAPVRNSGPLARGVRP